MAENLWIGRRRKDFWREELPPAATSEGRVQNARNEAKRAPALFDSLDGGAAPVPTTRQSGNGGKMAPKFNGTGAGAGVLLNSKNWRQSVPSERGVLVGG